MNKKGLIALIAIYFLYSLLFSNDCGFDQEYARSMVVKYLDAKSLPHNYLEFDQTFSDECRFSYMYEGHGEKINFVVIDDYVKGPKLTWWDYNKQGE